MEEIIGIILIIFMITCIIGGCIICMECLCDDPSCFCYKPHTEVVDTVNNVLQSEQPTTKQIQLSLVNPDHMK